MLNRIEFLERKLWGNSNPSPIKERVVALQEALAEIYSNMPDLAKVDQCMELEQELYLKRSALLEVVDKIKILNHSKDELLENINLLENIESMKSVVDKDFEILGYNIIDERLNNITDKLNTIKKLNLQQEDELNQLLDTYENMVMLLAEKSAEWNEITADGINNNNSSNNNNNTLSEASSNINNETLESTDNKELSELPIDLSKMKVSELKAELTKRGASTTGLKAVLIERLQGIIGLENETN